MIPLALALWPLALAQTQIPSTSATAVSEASDWPPAGFERLWQMPVPDPDLTGSARCIGCHAKEGAWQSRSVHAHSASPGLLGQLPTEGPHIGQSLACLFCHAPTSVQQPWRLDPKTKDAKQAVLDRQVSPIEAMTAALSGPLASNVQPNPDFHIKTQSDGVGCVTCHVRNGAVLVSPEHMPGVRAQAAHPIRVEPELSQPTFCAVCHQFSARNAVNGKPLENVYSEWKNSIWGQAGASCQGCHMPSGEHRFAGIHSKTLVQASVEVGLDVAPGQMSGQLWLTNDAVGHDFPSYTTPRVRLVVQPEDEHGRALGQPSELVIGRAVHFADGSWHEDFDTRVPPRQTARLNFDFSQRPSVRSLHATVVVEPDFAYVALFERLLKSGGLPAERTRQLLNAKALAQTSAFAIFEEHRDAHADIRKQRESFEGTGPIGNH
jgi:hypothetical protein